MEVLVSLLFVSSFYLCLVHPQISNVEKIIHDVTRLKTIILERASVIVMNRETLMRTQCTDDVINSVNSYMTRQQYMSYRFNKENIINKRERKMM